MNLPVYMTLLRVDRPKTKNALKSLKALPKTWRNNTKVYYVANVFGEWDNCVWFEADNHDHAMNFVQDKISTIPGVNHTYTLPTTPIRKYFRR